MQPGVYFAVNSPAGIVGRTADAAVATISGWGFPVTAAGMQDLARGVGEISLFGRTGGAPSLALGMAHIFAASGGGRALMAFWYHFAIMFEALFILTIIDAGTRVGRFMLQDALGHVWKPFGRTSWMPGVWMASAAVVFGWGYFLYNGVRDPLGGINTLWPLFGIANQLLASIALCVATTILLKMHGWRSAWITAAPLGWLLVVTLTASWQKIFSESPRIGFLAQSSSLEAAIRAGKVPAARLAETRTLIFNARLDAALCFILAVLVIAIVLDSLRLWLGAERVINEAPFVPSTLRPGEI
jgi:carbon starvation protein